MRYGVSFSNRTWILVPLPIPNTNVFMLKMRFIVRAMVLYVKNATGFVNDSECKINGIQGFPY